MEAARSDGFVDALRLHPMYDALVLAAKEGKIALGLQTLRREDPRFLRWVRSERAAFIAEMYSFLAGERQDTVSRHLGVEPPARRAPTPPPAPAPAAPAPAPAPQPPPAADVAPKVVVPAPSLADVMAEQKQEAESAAAAATPPKKAAGGLDEAGGRETESRVTSLTDLLASPSKAGDASDAFPKLQSPEKSMSPNGATQAKVSADSSEVSEEGEGVLDLATFEKMQAEKKKKLNTLTLVDNLNKEPEEKVEASGPEPWELETLRIREEQRAALEARKIQEEEAAAASQSTESDEESRPSAVEALTIDKLDIDAEGTQCKVPAQRVGSSRESR